MPFSLKPAPPKPRLPEDKIGPTYRFLREQVFLGAFIGYAGYYLLRNNFAFAIPYLVKEGLYTKTQLGFALAMIAIAYGWSKFIMGSISDRSDARKFLTLGLVLSACVGLILGLFPFAFSSIYIIAALLFLNGWVQGMGWAPCGRTMVHWFSKSERGTRMACWNVAHNTGGTSVGLLVPFGIVYLFNGDWVSMFYFPAFLVLGIAGIAWLLLRDTPQSCGLPPIEEYKNDYPEDYSKKHEEELSTWDIFFTYILPNQCLWYVAFANAFVYLVRFGVVTWVPTYLSEVRGYTITKAGFGFATYEIAGIMGTLLCGWLSDRVFRGQRAPACMLFMFLVSFFVCVYWLAPAEHPWLVYASLFAIGFLIYGPVMMIGLYALELAPKKAAGTAAGLTGLFGYMFGTLTANFGIGFAVDHLGGWNAGFIIIIASCFLACFFIGLAWCTKGQTSTQPSAGD